MSTYPKYLYLPDWCTDEDTKFTELFSYQNCTSAIKDITEDAGAKLLYHDNSNCNCNPELVFEIPNSVSAEILFSLLIGRKLNKDIPNDQVLSLAWENGEYYYGTDEEEWTIEDIHNFLKDEEDSNLVGK